jgi:hypothetical protein
MQNLYAALAKAQSEFQIANMSKSNPHRKSKFASIEDLIAASRPALQKHGLAVCQYPFTTEGITYLMTIVLHESGESCKSQLQMFTGDIKDYQEFGKAMTYATRYVYKNMLRIMTLDEDDDGESLCAPTPAKDWSEYPIKEWHLKDLKAVFDGYEDPAKLIALVLKKYGIPSLDKLKQKQFDEIMKEYK